MQANLQVPEVAVRRAAVYQLFVGFVAALRCINRFTSKKVAHYDALLFEIQLTQEEVTLWFARDGSDGNQKAQLCSSAWDVIYGTSLSSYAN